MAAHTPAPWRVLRRDRESLKILAQSIYVADISGSAENEESQADACLIAAAPDLLAALKGMLDQPDSSAAYDAMMERANAAIAKAEGRAG